MCANIHGINQRATILAHKRDKIINTISSHTKYTLAKDIALPENSMKFFAWLMAVINTACSLQVLPGLRVKITLVTLSQQPRKCMFYLQKSTCKTILLLWIQGPRGDCDCCEKYWYIWVIVGIIVIGLILTAILVPLCLKHNLDTAACRAKMEDMMTTTQPPFWHYHTFILSTPYPSSINKM